MGLSRSLSTGTSALRTFQRRFDFISNNLANINTIGYKSTRGNFVEQFNQVYNVGKSVDTADKGVGGVMPLQFGLGVRLAGITTDMTQGSIETTGRPFDLAIQGEGFFVYNNGERTVYSRAGIIAADKQGNIVDASTGAYLQGYGLQLDANGLIQKDADGVNILNKQVNNLVVSPNLISPPQQTTNVKVTGNLNSSASTGTSRETSIVIYDIKGAPHTLLMTFTKTANANEYTLDVKIDNTAIGTQQTITFNNEGSINNPNSVTLTSSDVNTALTGTSFNKDIKLQLADPANPIGGLTQYSAPNSATALEQNGYEPGELIDMSVDQSGKLMGSFTNGQSEMLGRVAIAKFTNPAALVRMGNNFLIESPNSGLANVGTAGDVFPSTKIVGGALEQSNVDMTVEFTEMISTQRAFEAASRTITVSDGMLAELNQLKR